MENELQKFLDSYILKKLETAKLPIDAKLILKYEMQQEIEIACETVFKKADKYVKGEINKFGILI